MPAARPRLDNHDLLPVVAAAKTRSPLTVALLMGTALAASFILPTASSIAQSTAAANTATFSIGPQALSSALMQFSNQTGLELFASADLLRGRASPGASGQMSSSDALSSLLAGTGLAYRLDGRSVRIIDPAAPAAPVADGSILLETIDVNAWVESATGPVGGIVARTSATGSKTDAELLDLSASLSVVGAEELERRGSKSLDSALGYTSGVSTNLYGADKRYDFVSIRGFVETGMGIYRDGMQNRVTNFTGSRVEPYGMERVEVLKGSTSTLYGLNAAGGLVNMVTKRPLDYQFGEVYTTVGNGHLESGADFGGPVDGNGQFLYRLTAKWQDGQDGHEWANDDRIYIAPSFTWKPTDATSLTILADYNNRAGANRYGIPVGSNVDPETYFGEKQFDQNDTVEWNIGYVFDHDFGNGLKFHQNARYTDQTLSHKSTYARESLPLTHAFGRYVMEVEGQKQRFSIDSNAQYTADYDWLSTTTLLGIDYSQTQQSESDTRGYIAGVTDLNNPVYCTPNCVISPVLTSPAYTGSGSEKTLGIYAQEDITLDERWILSLGARYDYVDAQADAEFDLFGMKFPDSQRIVDQALTKRAGLTWKATDEISLYGTYAESFYPVPPVPSFWGSLGTPSLSGVNKPVEGVAYEAGVKYQPEGMNALFTAAVFDITQTNVPYYVGFQRQQIGELNSRGFELEGKAAVTDDLNLMLSYTYLDSKIVSGEIPSHTGKRMQFIPEYMASAWVDYTIRGEGQFGDLTFGAGARLVGPRYADNVNTVQLDPYVVVDASVNYQINENASLSLTVANLFDTVYVSHVETWSDPDTEFFGDRRSTKATLKWKW